MRKAQHAVSSLCFHFESQFLSEPTWWAFPQLNYPSSHARQVKLLKAQGAGNCSARAVSVSGRPGYLEKMAQGLSRNTFRKRFICSLLQRMNTERIKPFPWRS